MREGKGSVNLTQKDPNHDHVSTKFDKPARTPAMLCPHCPADPMQMEIHVVTFMGGLPVAVFVCTGCRNVIGTSIIPPMPEPSQRQESRLVLP